MIVNRIFKHRLKPNEASAQLRQVQGSTRYLYNWLLSEYNTILQKEERYPGKNEMNALLMEYRQQTEFLQSVPANVCQAVLADLYSSVNNHAKNPAHYKRPRFKKKNDNQDSFRFPVPKTHTPITRINGCLHVRVPLIGWVEYYSHYPDLENQSYEGRVLSITIKQDSAGEQWVSFTCEMEVPEPALPTEKKIVGIDLGVKNSYVSTDETGQSRLVHLPVITKKERARLGRLQASFDRKQNDPVTGHYSRNKEKARKRLNKNRLSIIRRRDHAMHEYAHWLTSNYNVIITEDLKIKNMTASAKGTIRTWY